LISTVTKFVTNIGYNIIADLSTKLSNSLVILLLSYYLGVADMGSYSLAHTFFTFGLLFSYWGFGNLLTREIARDRNSYSKYLSNFSILRLIFAVIILAIINSIVPYLGYVEQTQQAIRIISIGIIANTIINLIYALFIAFEELKYLSMISITVGVLRVIGCFVILHLGGSVVKVVVFSTLMEFVSLAVSLLFVSRIIKSFYINFDIKFSFQQIIKAFPFFWIAVLVILDSQVEILVISIILNESFVGFYTAMNTIMGGLALFSEGVRNAVFPIFARYQINSPEKLKKMILILVKYISLITFPIAISVFFLAEEIILLLFGSGYEISGTLLKIIVWSFIGHTLKVVYIRLLMVHDKEKLLALSLLVSAMLTLVFNILLVPILGLVGVAIIRLVTTYILLFLCMYFVSRQRYRIIEPFDLFRISVASIILFLSVFLLHSLLPYFGILIGLILYVCAVWFSRVIDRSDIKLWNDVFHGLIHRSAID